MSKEVELFICPACGASISPGAKYCEWCGSQFIIHDSEAIQLKNEEYIRVCGQSIIPRHIIPFMSEEEIYRKAVKDIATSLVDKLIVEKVITVRSNYDIHKDVRIYTGTLNVVLPK